VIKVGKILIIEDCHLVRIQIRRILEKSGFQDIEELNSADEINLRPHQYLKDVTLILLDIGLPGISGLEFAKQLKAHPKYWNIPVMFISGFNDSQTVQAAIDAGGIDFITKPIKFDLLAKRIKEVMDTYNKPTDNQTKIADLIVKEYDRASRASTPLSFLIIQIENQNLDEARLLIEKTIRKIDSVLRMEDKIFVALPLTGEKNVNTVINKIQDKIKQAKLELTIEKSVFFEPSSGKMLDQLEKELFG
jgi:DNA-binding response OmpR family regulator